jgi:hypothetical protein
MPLLFLSPTLSREGSVLWEAERVHLEWKMDDCPNVQAQRAAVSTAPVAPRSFSRPSPTHAKTTPSASGEDHTLGLRAAASQQVPCSTREQSCTMQCDYPQSNQAHAVFTPLRGTRRDVGCCLHETVSAVRWLGISPIARRTASERHAARSLLFR